MAPSNKIRENAVVRYYHVPAQPRNVSGNVMSQSLPMAAMFLKNKAIAWSSLFLAIQAYLNEPKNKPLENDSSAASAGAQPPLFQVIFAIIGLATCYMDVFFPVVAPIAKNVADTVAEVTGK